MFFNPASLADIAAASPAGPPPMITRSVFTAFKLVTGCSGALVLNLILPKSFPLDLRASATAFFIPKEV